MESLKESFEEIFEKKNFGHLPLVTRVPSPSNRSKTHSAEYCGRSLYPFTPIFGQKVYLSKIYVLGVGIFLLSNGCYGNLVTSRNLVTIATVAKEVNSHTQNIVLT